MVLEVERKITKVNRLKSKKASKSKFWCASCDRALVGQFGKCLVCGNRANNKKNK
jgi:hypothetical protein